MEKESPTSRWIWIIPAVLAVVIIVTFPSTDLYEKLFVEKKVAVDPAALGELAVKLALLEGESTESRLQYAKFVAPHYRTALVRKIRASGISGVRTSFTNIVTRVDAPNMTVILTGDQIMYVGTNAIRSLRVTQRFTFRSIGGTNYLVENREISKK